MIGFQTGPGSGGREGLKPRSRWFSVAKWQALAVQQVATRARARARLVVGLGAARRTLERPGQDVSPRACGCGRATPSLCDAPGVLGRELDADVTTGQLEPARPGRAACTGRRPLTASSVAALAKVTGTASSRSRRSSSARSSGSERASRRRMRSALERRIVRISLRRERVGVSRGARGRGGEPAGGARASSATSSVRARSSRGSRGARISSGGRRRASGRRSLRCSHAR